jgi:hypothetical protein
MEAMALLVSRCWLVQATLTTHGKFHASELHPSELHPSELHASELYPNKHAHTLHRPNTSPTKPHSTLPPNPQTHGSTASS